MPDFDDNSDIKSPTIGRLAYFGWWIVANILVALYFYARQTDHQSLCIAAILGSVIIRIIATILRLNDTGLSMWFVVAEFIPGANVVIEVALMFRPGLRDGEVSSASPITSLFDAPEFDEAREHRRVVMMYSAAGVLFTLFVGWWLVAGHPVDWPWQWNNHLRGRMTVNAFFTDLEKNDLTAAYGVWIHDKNWQQHPDKHAGYTFDRFEKDWSPASPDNDYGQIHSHRIAAARMIGNVLQTGTFINERKSKAINLDYDPKDHTLSYSPEDVQFLEGPGGIS